MTFLGLLYDHIEIGKHAKKNNYCFDLNTWHPIKVFITKRVLFCQEPSDIGMTIQPTTPSPISTRITFGDVIDQTQNIKKPSLSPLLLIPNKLIIYIRTMESLLWHGRKNIDGQILEINFHKKLLNWIIFQKNFRHRFEAVNSIRDPWSPKVSPVEFFCWRI